MTVIALVPVRGGSKGLPGKNLRELAGHALWQHAVLQGQAAGVDRVVVTTDIPEALTAMPGVEILQRPPELARDDTPMAPVVQHALAAVPGPARVVLLQPTSPLRAPEDIAQAISLHAAGGFELVKTVTATDPGILKYGRLEGDRFAPLDEPEFCFSNRQSLPPVYRPNGAVYVFDRDWFLRNGGFVTDRIGAVVMPPERSFDIDSEEDFQRAEAMLTR